ncbi:MAG: iron-containing alcohol dehydrogenase, partial [Enterovibrio sp.]
SVIDGAKFIAAAIHFAGDPWDILVAKAKFEQAVPIGAVLTLPATGSESNGNSVVTNKATMQKRSFLSPLVQPQFAVLDPEFTYSLPARQISNGIVDAFVHVVEQYLTYPVHAEIQDRFAESILQTLLDVGPKALKQPKEYQHRANLMWAATMALNGLIGAGVPQDWSTHIIGHEITALYGIDHAQTLAIVLPALLFVQRHQKHAKLVQLGRRVFAIHDTDEAVVVDQTIKAIQDFFETVGVKTRLSDHQLSDQVVPEIINNLERNGMTALGEHGDINLTKVAAILGLAL